MKTSVAIIAASVLSSFAGGEPVANELTVEQIPPPAPPAEINLTSVAALEPQPPKKPVADSEVPGTGVQKNEKASQPIATAKPGKTQEPDESDSPPKKTFDLTFDDLKFEMKKGDNFARSMLTPKINSYHNGTIRLRGYIRPSFSQSGLTKFIFVRDNKECCFGPGAAIYDCVLVRLSKGEETEYVVRPITVEGKFSLKEYKGPDGKVWSIYRMNEAKVK